MTKTTHHQGVTTMSTCGYYDTLGGRECTLPADHDGGHDYTPRAEQQTDGYDLTSRAVQTVQIPGALPGRSGTTAERKTIDSIRAAAQRGGLKVHINQTDGAVLLVRFADR